jgi:5-methylcytosine-specific restriction endonuclease McrA
MATDDWTQDQMARCSRNPQREPDAYHETMGGISLWLCDSCNQPSPEPFVLNYLDDNEILICDSCAGAIANYWNYAHSGRYITWENQLLPYTGQRPKIAASKRKQIYERDAYRCRYCGGYKDLVLDHVQPYAKLGTDEEENLVTACTLCNSKKRDRTPEEAGMILLPPPNE